MRRGELWWASLGEPTGSIAGYRRPVVIVSANDFNESTIATVVMVPVSSNLRRAGSPGNVRLPARLTGLSKDSVAQLPLIASISRLTLTARISRLPEGLMRTIDDGLRDVLGLR